MTLITTPGDPNADSYAAVADADAYFAALGNLLWTATDTWKEVYLRRATRYLDNQYRHRWIGIKATETQSLLWPRVDGKRTLYRISLTYPLLDIDGFQIPMDGVPEGVVKATIELAYLALSGASLEPRLTQDDQQILSQTSKVDVLEKTITRRAGGAAMYERYAVVEGLLRGLVTSTPGAFSGTMPVVRA